MDRGKGILGGKVNSGSGEGTRTLVPYNIRYAVIGAQCIRGLAKSTLE